MTFKDFKEITDTMVNGLKMKNKKIIKIDLSGCKDWDECSKVIELITSRKIKITVNKK